ncbi:hypothetical protein IJ380_02380 [Candidatus Saccharibacteria bacterium]|nr:hypothetical protein [Candidatus Saccharibacteria bacterium]
MSLLNFKKPKSPAAGADAQAGTVPPPPVDTGVLAELALKTIHDGVVIVNKAGVIRFLNPAAIDMIGIEKAENAVNLDVALVMKFELTDGTRIDAQNNDLVKYIKANTPFETKDYVLVSTLSDKKTPVALTMTPTGNSGSDKIITFRNIAKELEEEGAQAEFISTASHEMRTPVASIEGYLGLALNPQTATIDARARQYLESAHSASQRLGNLFKDLLDVTKLEDNRLRAKPIPIELSGFVKKFADEYSPKFREKNITYTFGAEKVKTGRFGGGGSNRIIDQVVYTFADVDFLGEILANLIENAIKYTPIGGAVWVNVQGDGDRALINVTDTGIGIAAEDLQHIFQKFYRADNSQTRTVGGTGLGLYIVKQRTEAMDGRVWAESAFGEGSTFFVSLPRLTQEEYEKRQIAVRNQKAVEAFSEQALADNQKTGSMATSLAPAPGQPMVQIAQQQVYAMQGAQPTVGVAPTLQPLQQPGQQPVQPLTSQPIQQPVQQPVQQFVQAPAQPQIQVAPPPGAPAIQNNQNIIQ